VTGPPLPVQSFSRDRSLQNSL